jgi:TonB family protein
VAHAACEWTVVPQQGATPAAFLDQNEDASRYLLRKLPAADLASRVLANPQPAYPTIARAAHISGSVSVRLIVSGNGAVTSATAISGPAMLRGEAEVAAKHWTFHPLLVGTQPTPFVVDLTADFRLAGNLPNGLPLGTATMHP